jgi:hypothetical protein
MTFAKIKTEILSRMNLQGTDADSRVGVAINRHYKRITSLLGLDQTRFVTRSASTTNGVATVTFTSIEHIDRLLDTTDSDAIRLLPEVSIHTIRGTQPGTGEPTRYAIQASGAASSMTRRTACPRPARSAARRQHTPASP